jgi:hypothetical protein
MAQMSTYWQSLYDLHFTEDVVSIDGCPGIVGKRRVTLEILSDKL